MRCLPFALAIVLLAAPAPAADEPAKKADGPTKDELDKSVDRALDFLQRTQLPDGGWKGQNDVNPAVTSLAVMAFLSAGHVPGEGKYGETVEKGVRWVLAAQADNGLIAKEGQQEMYHHGICTLMLAEVAGMTDGKLGEEVLKKLEKAVKLILNAQRKDDNADRGGWRYHWKPGQDNPASDMSVTAWQVMALRAAKNLGCDVPADAIDRAVEYIKRCREPDSGGFRYTPTGRMTVACTGASVLSLELCGKKEHGTPELNKAGAYLVKAGPKFSHEFCFYALYYCSQAVFQLGNNYWESYRPQLHDLLLKSQKDNGSWFANSGDAMQGGPNYCTAMCVLSLTVEYRYLPIYQRGEEPTDKK
jgi:hypothetical protein